MKPRLSGYLALITVLTAAVATCKGSPVAGGAGDPFLVISDFRSVNVKNGGTGLVTSWVLDIRADRILAPIAFAACNGAIASVALDATYKPAPATSSRAVITGVSVGSTCAVVSSSGLKPDTVAVTVTP